VTVGVIACGLLIFIVWSAMSAIPINAQYFVHRVIVLGIDDCHYDYDFLFEFDHVRLFILIFSVYDYVDGFVHDLNMSDIVNVYLDLSCTMHCFIFSAGSVVEDCACDVL
jgi:hypothetical protein